MKNTIYRTLIAALLLATCALTSGAQEGKGFSRGQSVIVRIGAGLPSNFNVGGGYQFTPFLDAKAGFGT